MKMMSPSFIHNLKQDGFAAAAEGFLSPNGFLIAPENAKGALKLLAEEVAKSTRRLFIDNGNYGKLASVRKLFEAEAAELHGLIEILEREQGHRLRRGEIPSEIRDRYRLLATRVRLVARGAVPSDNDMFKEQLALNPDVVIGTEDLTMASWIGLNIERQYLGESRTRYRKLNRVVAQRAAAMSVPLKLRGSYFPVASAVDHDTARDAGREFAEAGIKAIAMGFGAYMADNNYSDHIYIDSSRIDFGGNLPQRYTRTVAVAVGFWRGYSETAGKGPERFHFLGLGAPIMAPLVTLAAASTPELTFDATSPILDAIKGGTLYSDKPALLKLRTRKIAFRLARTPGRTWDCPCPFCGPFQKRHPFRYDVGNAWFARLAPNAATAADLSTGGPLTVAYPLFSEPSGGELRKDVNQARVGHNHWFTDRGMTSLHRAIQRGDLASRVSNIVSNYQANTKPQFGEAVGFAFKLITDLKAR
jgi:hypothetical protein